MMKSRRQFLKSTCLWSLPFVAYPNTVIGSNNDFQKYLDKILLSAKNLALGKDLVLRIMYPDGCLANLLPIVSIFEKRTNVKVKLIKSSVEDINTKILNTAMLQESSFDIALPATYGLPDLAEVGALTNLDHYVKKYEAPFYSQNALYKLGDSYNGSKFGYQTDGDVYVMFYLEHIFKKNDFNNKYADLYGEEIKVPSSWYELDRLMTFFHEPDKNRFGGCLFRTPGYIVWEWWLRFHSFGIYPFADDMTANIDSEAGMLALESLIKSTDFQHPSVYTNDLFENWRLYEKGNCLVNIGWGGTQKYIRRPDSRLEHNVIIAPTPDVSYFNWGWNYVVSNYSQHKEIAYLFCLLATMPQVSNYAIREEEGFFDPFRKEHYEDPHIQQAYGIPFLKTHFEAMSKAIPDLYMQERSAYIQVLEDSIFMALEGDLTIEKAMRYTAQQWERITDEVGRKKQIEQWLHLKNKYPKSFGR